MREVTYIYLAIGSGMLGIAITFAVIFLCQYFGIDMLENLWVLAIPVISSVLLNIGFVELYRRFKKK